MAAYFDLTVCEIPVGRVPTDATDSFADGLYPEPDEATKLAMIAGRECPKLAINDNGPDGEGLRVYIRRPRSQSPDAEVEFLIPTESIGLIVDALNAVLAMRSRLSP